MTIRPAETSDFARIAAIYGHYVLNGLASFEEEAPDEGEMRERWRKIDALHLPYFVATIDGEVAGYAYASQYRPRRAYRYTIEDSIYIDLSHQRKGIGSALLSLLIETTAVQGYRQMIAVIGDSANVPSIALHEGFGFRRVGVLESVGYKFERWVDTVIMQRSLA